MAVVVAVRLSLQHGKVPGVKSLLAPPGPRPQVFTGAGTPPALFANTNVPFCQERRPEAGAYSDEVAADW